MKCSYDRENIVILKYATKPFNVLLACTRPLITELANNPQSVIGKLVPFCLETGRNSCGTNIWKANTLKHNAYYRIKRQNRYNMSLPLVEECFLLDKEKYDLKPPKKDL